MKYRLLVCPHLQVLLNTAVFPRSSVSLTKPWSCAVWACSPDDDSLFEKQSSKSIAVGYWIGWHATWDVLKGHSSKKTPLRRQRKGTFFFIRERFCESIRVQRHPWYESGDAVLSLHSTHFILLWKQVPDSLKSFGLLRKLASCSNHNTIVLNMKSSIYTS